ncbi:hypothetical protein EDI_198570 [Entamoeba dispar SAW760]|uniref:Uncharacterized protein n=1 Tax=Entamoeba dispar (strain ATCC PRA-260 / SAW760) TaxID=370354 RepID=B0EMV4_ENTDS|nr:uncharacterized protein EDI_198570 [Entamoeba dispar SAW760]EDR24078.1 hypothetical protein EDI_198570 [Entamoeba dispar SAW760]|eukprot:EDR24078.1 hypothetical protein EDI_198570 [Entamoeba dispar SAW760]
MSRNQPVISSSEDNSGSSDSQISGTEIKTQKRQGFMSRRNRRSLNSQPSSPFFTKDNGRPITMTEISGSESASVSESGRNEVASVGGGEWNRIAVDKLSQKSRRPTYVMKKLKQAGISSESKLENEVDLVTQPIINDDEFIITNQFKRVRDSEDGEFIDDEIEQKKSLTNVSNKKEYDEKEELFRPNWIKAEQYDFSSRGIKPRAIFAENNACLMIDSHNCFLFRDNDFHMIPNLYKETIQMGIIDPTGVHIILLYSGNKMSYCERIKLSPVFFNVSYPEEVIKASGNKEIKISTIRFEQKASMNTELNLFVGTNTGCIFSLTVHIKKNPIQTTSVSVYPLPFVKDEINERSLSQSGKHIKSKIELVKDITNFKNEGEITDIFWVIGSICTVIVACTNSVVFQIIIETKGSNKFVYVSEVSNKPPYEIIEGSKGMMIVQYEGMTEDAMNYRLSYLTGQYKLKDGRIRRSLFRGSYAFFSNDKDIDKFNEKGISNDYVDSDFVIETPNQVYQLYPNSLVCFDYDYNTSCTKLVEGKSICMTLEKNNPVERYIWVCTEYSLYKIHAVKPDYEEFFDVQLIQNMMNDETLIFVLLRALDKVICDSTNIKSRLRISLLYTWCVILILNNVRIQDQRELLKKKLTYLLKKRFYAKTIIDKEIIRYLIRNCGDRELFIWYCETNNDMVGLLNYYIENCEYSEGIEVLIKMYSSEEAEEREECIQLTKKYFGVLFREEPLLFNEYLKTRDIFGEESLYTVLSLVGEEIEFNILQPFIRNLINQRTHDGMDVSELLEILFWKYLKEEPGASAELDKNMNSLLFSRINVPITSIYIIRELKRRRMYRSLSCIYENNGNYAEAIEMKGLMIKQSDKQLSQLQDEIDKMFELVGKEPNEQNRETLVVQALKWFVDACDTGVGEKYVLDVIKNHKISIQSVLASLPLILPSFRQWKLKDMMEMIDAKFKEYKTNGDDLLSMVFLSNSQVAEMSQKLAQKELSFAEPSFQYVVYSDDDVCSMCRKKLNPAESQLIMFCCGHKYHCDCIINELNLHKTPFAVKVLTEYEKDEDLNVLANECLLCSCHATELTRFSLDETNDDSWNL